MNSSHKVAIYRLCIYIIFTGCLKPHLLAKPRRYLSTFLTSWSFLLLGVVVAHPVVWVPKPGFVSQMYLRGPSKLQALLLPIDSLSCL